MFKTLNYEKNKNLNIVIGLNYHDRLRVLNEWYRQIFAESLGKNKFGMTPVTSICPKDHHSMMQLYLDGFENNFFTFFY